MNINRKKLIITATAGVLLLAMAGASKPGRATLTRVVSLVRPNPPALGNATLSAPAASPGPDIEQRARAAHHWSARVVNSVVRGTIDYYNREGMVTRQARLTIYRKYPDRLRVEIESGGVVQVSGFDGRDAWKAGASTVTEEEARDIRAWLRLSPERLFVARDGGRAYKEAGRRSEDHRPAAFGKRATEIEPPLIFDQVQVVDAIGGPGANPRGTSDERRITHYVNAADSIIASSRWLEPDDPRLNADDPETDRVDVRVDYSSWQLVDGVLWPMEVTHWLGGKVDFRVDVKDVLVNQQLKDDVFNKP